MAKRWPEDRACCSVGWNGLVFEWKKKLERGKDWETERGRNEREEEDLASSQWTPNHTQSPTHIPAWLPTYGEQYTSRHSKQSQREESTPAHPPPRAQHASSFSWIAPWDWTKESRLASFTLGHWHVMAPGLGYVWMSNYSLMHPLLFCLGNWWFKDLGAGVW